MPRSLALLVGLALVSGCKSPSPSPSPSPGDATGALQPDASARTPVDAIKAAALEGSRAYELVSRMTELGPRASGTAGDAAAVEWAKRTLTANGFTNVHTEKAMVPHWERGAETAELTSPTKEPLHVTALGGSAATPAGGIEAEVLEVESLGALEKLAKDAARGKIVFINARTRRARDGAGYGEAVGGRFAGARAAQKVGAVAMVLRSVGTADDQLPHTGAKSKDDHEIPAAALSIVDSERLQRVLAEKKAARLKLVLTPRWLPDVESANVIGEIRGREKPDEIVVIGAHHDSWDLATGALDDGAGCAIAIEAGRVIGSLPERPRRTVRVVLFANEEHGRAGALAYAKEHATEAPRIVLALEADMGGDRVYEARFLGGPGKAGAWSAIAQPLTSLGVELGTADANSGADTATLRELGVPVIELRQDATRYFDIHHSAGDTLDKVDAKALAQAAAAFALVAWGAADLPEDLGRIPQEKRAERW